MVFALIHTALLLLPAWLANMAPIPAAKFLPDLNTPIDFGLTLRGQRLLGANKTWRGLVVGTLAGGAGGLIQALIFGDLKLFWLGFVGGAVALIGDALGSMIKRQLGFAPGKVAPILDQLDYVVLYILVSQLWFTWGWLEIGIALILALILNPICNLVARIVKLRSSVPAKQ